MFIRIDSNASKLTMQQYRALIGSDFVYQNGHWSKDTTLDKRKVSYKEWLRWLRVQDLRATITGDDTPLGF